MCGDLLSYVHHTKLMANYTVVIVICIKILELHKFMGVNVNVGVYAALITRGYHAIDCHAYACAYTYCLL